jgi:hypothetical protein
MNIEKYMSIEELTKNYPQLISAVKTKKKSDIIATLQIPASQYKWFVKTNDKYSETTDKMKDSQLYVKREWLNKLDNPKKETSSNSTKKEEICSQDNPSDDDEKDDDDNEDQKKTSTKEKEKNTNAQSTKKSGGEEDLPNAQNQPNNIVLNEHEKYKTLSGKIVNMTLLGRRCEGECFFSHADIAGISVNKKRIYPNSYNTIRKSYVKDSEYTYFKMFNGGLKLYLSHTGCLKMLSVYIDEEKQNFIEWLNKVLYTEKKQKSLNELIAELVEKDFIINKLSQENEALKNELEKEQLKNQVAILQLEKKLMILENNSSKK